MKTLWWATMWFGVCCVKEEEKEVSVEEKMVGISPACTHFPRSEHRLRPSDCLYRFPYDHEMM